MVTTDIQFVIRSLGYGIYITEGIKDAVFDDVINKLTEYGFEVYQAHPNANNDDQAFIVTKRWQLPVDMEFNQLSDVILADLKDTVKATKCEPLAERMRRLKHSLDKQKKDKDKDKDKIKINS
jgi:hypothetical protein